MREGRSTLAADMSRRELIFGGVGSWAGRGLLALAWRLAAGGGNESTATQQDAAPDRLQPCVPLASSLHSGLPAAGELGRYALTPFVSNIFNFPHDYFLCVPVKAVAALKPI